MRLVQIGVAILALSSAGTLVAGQPHTSDGVREVENAWSDAFISGDAKRLDSILSPGYVSVSSKGLARNKADILAISTAYARSHPGQHGKPLAPTATIEIHGDTALVRHTSPTERAVDLFRYDDGRWVAWYSQHTDVVAGSN